MATENDIKRFVQENKIRLPKDDKFMEELVRQINLLPTPANLSERESNPVDNARIISLICKALKKHNRKIAAESIVVSITICGLLMCLAFAIGGINSQSHFAQIVIDFRYLICGVACLVFIFAYNNRIVQV